MKVQMVRLKYLLKRVWDSARPSPATPRDMVICEHKIKQTDLIAFLAKPGEGQRLVSWRVNVKVKAEVKCV